MTDTKSRREFIGAAAGAGMALAIPRGALGAEEIVTPSAENRMVAFPYPKRMTANIDVDPSRGAGHAGPGPARHRDRCRHAGRMGRGGGLRPSACPVRPRAAPTSG